MDKIKKYFENNFLAISTLFYMVLCFIKMRQYLIHGRFWAEEGTFFYSDISRKNIFDGIFYIFNGHLEIVTNIIVYASTLVDLMYAPLVTTYLSLVVQFIPICILIKYGGGLSLSRLNILLVILFAAGVPQALEVWANSINLHFHFCLVVVLIAAINIPSGPPKWISRCLLGFSGLSGIPSNFLVPVFAFLAVGTKEKERWIQFCILSSTAFLQICLLVFNDFQGGHREYFSNPLVFWLAPVAQLVISPLFGYSVGDQLVVILRDISNFSYGSFVFAIIFSMPLIYFILILFSSKLASTRVVVFSAFALLFMCILTALGDKSILVSSANGGRYFYVPNILLAIAFLVSIKKYNIFNFAIVFLLVIASCGNMMYSIGGPDWMDNFDISGNPKDFAYEIWPNGWSMVVEGEK